MAGMATLVRSDDWQALYVNGSLSERAQQNYELDVADALAEVCSRRCTAFEVLHVDQVWSEQQVDGFPFNLNEIPEEVRE